MTRDEIEKLSDEELNALVATEVMEWEWTNLSEDKILVPPLDDSRISWATEWDAEGIPRYLPDYSTDIAAAWEVLGKFTYYKISRFGGSNCRVQIDNWIVDSKTTDDWCRMICRAALLAKMRP